MTVLESPRLWLRPFATDDAPALHSVVGNDPGMTWDGSHRSVEYVARTVAERMQHFTKHGFGVWAVIEKRSLAMVGQCGLQILSLGGDVEDVELVAYTVRRLWRQGVATEACQTALRYGFEVLHLERIVAVVREDNEVAQAFAARLGFQFLRRDFVYGADVAVSQLKHSDFNPAEYRYRVLAGTDSVPI